MASRSRAPARARPPPRGCQLLAAFRVGAAAVAVVVAIIAVPPGPAAYPVKTPMRRTRNVPSITASKHRPWVDRPPSPLLTSEELDLLESEVELMDCQEHGNWIGAREVLDQMAARKIPRRREAWLSAINANAKAGRWENAAGLLQEMKEARVRPDQDAFHAAMEACDGQNVPDQALKIAQQMQDAGYALNTVAYVKLITQVMLEGRKEEAHKLYKEAQEEGHLLAWTMNGNKLDLSDYNEQLAEVMVRSACIERATQFWAGKGGFSVEVGEGPANYEKLRRVTEVMKNEYGLKIRVAPRRFGRLRVRRGELKRLSEERILEGKQPRHGNRRASRIRQAYVPEDASTL